MSCDLVDEDGRSRDLRQERTCFADDGIALLTKVVTASFVADCKISDVRVER